MRGPTVALLLAVAALCYASAVPAPKADGKKVVCYYGSWAVYRPGDGKFDVEQIDPFICTHIIYGFVGLAFDGTLTVLDAYNDLEENWGKGAMKRFTGLKSQNPDLKAMVAIGGWNEGSEKYSNMAATRESRQRFIASVIPFLQSQNFDGLDLDWEYPAHRGGRPEDKENFDLLMAELREEFDKHGYLLTAAVSAGEATIVNAYNVPNLAKYLDFINVMAYDFHGAWEGHPYTHHHCPLYEHPQDAANNYTTFNVDYAMKLWNRLGAPNEKLILGMATYGRGFTLNDANENGVYAPANLPISAGPYTREPGFWGYNEICTQLQSTQWDVINDAQFASPYAHNANRQWIGYENPQSIQTKSEYALQNGLGGGMVWSLETDDFRGDCGEPFAIIKTIRRTLNGDIPTPGPTTTTTTTEYTGPTDDTTTTTTTVTPPPVTSPPGEGVCQQNGLNPDPNDCSTFYHCSWNGDHWLISTYHCGPGTIFDPSIGGCNFPGTVPGC